MAEKTVKLEDPANNRMGSAKMLPLILTMALPAMFSMLIQALYNIVDSYFVAQVSQNALTAVSLAFPIQNLLVAFGVGTGVGVSSLISRRLGERDQEAADNAATHGIILSAITYVVFAVFGAIVARPFTALYTQDAEVLSMGTTYITIVTVASFGFFFAAVIEKMLQATGNMVMPMIMKDIYVVGLPSIVMNAIGTLMTMAMNGILAGFSAVAVNVFGVYFKLQSFVFMPVFGLTQGLMPIMGYNYGARDKKRVTGAVKIGCVIALIIEIAGLIVFEICPGTLISIFNATPELHEIGDSALRIIAIHFPMAAIGIALSTLFQATGHGMYSLVQSVMRQLVVLVPAAWLLSKISLGAVWFCFPISEFISLIVTVVFFVILYNKEIKNLDKPVNSAAATESVKG